MKSWRQVVMILALCGAGWGATAAGVSAQSKDLREAERLTKQVVQLYGAGRYDEAAVLAERVLTIKEKVLGASHPDVAEALNNLALLCDTRGDAERAEPLYQRALTIYEQTLGAKHPSVATALNNLASLRFGRGDYERAEPLYQRALSIREQALGAKHPDVAVSLNNLAELYRVKGEYGRAEPLYQRALAIREKALGEKHPDVAQSLASLALLYEATGDYERAGPLHQRALAIREQALGAEHPEVAVSLNNLAGLSYLTGDYGRAETLHKRALAIKEKTFGAEHPEVALSLNNLAGVYDIQGDYKRAEPLYQRALEIREKALGAEHPEVATSLNNLALLYEAMGDSGRAEPLYQYALAIKEKAYGAGHPEVAIALNNLAALYLAGGDYGRAEPLYQRVLAVNEAALGAEHPVVAQSLNNLAALHEATGDYERALAGLTRAADIRERNIALILNAGSEKQKQLYLNTISGETEGIVSFNLKAAPENAAAARLALTTILRRKGRALDVMTDHIAALRSRATPADQKLLDQLAEARSQLANLQLGVSIGNLAPAERKARLVAFAEEIERLEAAVSRRSAEFRAQAQPVTLSNVQAALPADAALVEIVSIQPFNAKAQPGQKRFGAARYVAYVARREGEPRFVDLGEAAPIEAHVEKFRAALRDPKREDARELARLVDEQLTRPIRSLLGATRRVFLSPDGALNLIPFAALVDERGRYLVEDYSITYLTSGRDLLRLQVAGESKSLPVVMANPLYDAGGGVATVTPAATVAKREVDFRSIDFSKVRFAPLPGTAEEAKALSALLPGSRVLTGGGATEAALKQVHGPRLLHVATHGFFLNDQPPATDASGLKIGLGAGPGDVAAAAAPLRSENLLLRSGLILASVNQRRSGEGEDGVLTAAEAATLDLWGTKLVVLSACETGLGEVKNGAGVYGLRRALVLAGSESQVMSLWQVSDEATRDLMKGYYTRLQRGEGRTEALRQVQLEMLRGTALQTQSGEQRGLSGAPDNPTRVANQAHPFYWAAFIQSGAWTSIENNPAGTK